jgi:hypothetical protein
VQLEIEEVDDEPALAALSEAAAGVDSALAEAAGQKAYGIGVKNSTGRISIQKEARVKVGNKFAETVLSRDVRVAGRRRLSPPRGAGWEPVNTFLGGICRAKKSHHRPALSAGLGYGLGEGSEALTPPTSDKGIL